MNTSEFSRALLSGQTEIDPHALTQRVLARDRRRVFGLSALCVIAWMAVVMLPWATTLPAIHKFVVTQYPASSTAAADHTTQPLPDLIDSAAISTFLLSIGSMLLAALCTVTLIVASRRATLRQMNARLAEISAQLKLLAEPRRS